MLGRTPVSISIVFLLTCTLSPARGQTNWHDRPLPFVGLRPLTQKDIARRESLKQYVLGLLYARDDRLLEAVEALEKAAKLDPEATEVHKALIPFYVTLERNQDALAATRKVLDIDPEDYEVWYMYARQLKGQGKTAEACSALVRALALPALREHPEAAQSMYLLLGVLRENQGDLLPAAEAFREAAKMLDRPEPLLDIAPLPREALAARAAELYERIGAIYLKAKQYDRAVEAYREAQGRSPEGAGRLSLNLALVFQKQGKLDDALKAVEAYLRLLPQGMEAYELKIQLLQNLGRPADILPWLEQAARADRFNVGLALLLARSHGAAGQVLQAEKIYEDLAGKAPAAEVYRGLLRLYVDEPRLGAGRALALLDKTLQSAKNRQPLPSPAPVQGEAMVAALRDDPALAKRLVDFAYAASGAGQSQPQLGFHTLHLLAALADRQRQLNEAEKFYRACLNRPPAESESLVYGGLLRVLWRERKYKDIVMVCRQGLAQAQSTSASLFHNDLANALSRLGEMKQALAEAELGLKQARDGDRFFFRRLRVRILAMAGRFDQAEAECLAMLKEAGQPGELLETHALLSSVYSLAHKLSQAEQQLEIVLKLDPNNATANNDLGYIWADQGKNLKQAEELIRKAIDLDRQQRKKATSAESDEDSAAYIDSLGWVLFRRGQVEAARHELERAVKLPDGDDPAIYDHLGDVYYRLRQVDRARSAWRQALTLYERDQVRTMDEKYRDVQRKYKLLDSARQP